MALHYIDGDGTKACGPCKGSGRRRPRKERGARVCVTCHGAGRIADQEARAIDVGQSPTGAWRWSEDGKRWSRAYPTEAAALEAARRERRACPYGHGPTMLSGYCETCLNEEAR